MLRVDAEVSELCPTVYSLSGTPAAGGVPVKIRYQSRHEKQCFTSDLADLYNEKKIITPCCPHLRGPQAFPASLSLKKQTLIGCSYRNKGKGLILNAPTASLSLQGKPAMSLQTERHSDIIRRF